MQSVEEISTRRRLYDDGGWPYCVVREVVCCVLAGTRASERGEARRQREAHRRNGRRPSRQLQQQQQQQPQQPQLNVRPCVRRRDEATDRPTDRRRASKPVSDIDYRLLCIRRTSRRHWNIIMAGRACGRAATSRVGPGSLLPAPDLTAAGAAVRSFKRRR